MLGSKEKGNYWIGHKSVSDVNYRDKSASRSKILFLECMKNIFITCIFKLEKADGSYIKHEIKISSSLSLKK